MNKAHKTSFLSIGMMTGSSMDGIDAAVLESDGNHKATSIVGASSDFSRGFQLALRIAEFATSQERGNLVFAAHKFTDYIKNYLKEFEIDNNLLSEVKKEFEISDIFNLTLDLIIRKFTCLHALLVEQLLVKINLPPNAIDVIGFHGQNLYHNPDKGITIQVGDGQLLADKTKIPVVNNFRENDVKNGGQGAPFAPIYHQVLAGQKGIYPLAIVNCGGIANITIINGPETDQMIGFDTGPGNVLIDRFIRLKTKNHEMMDQDGKFGSKGTVKQSILKLLREQAIGYYHGDYLKKFPPKCLDSSHFKLSDEIMELSIEDGCANLEAFTAHCIVESLDLITTSPPKTYILAGGGWNNPVITNFLTSLLIEKIGRDVSVFKSSEYGWNSQYLEAEIFAYLAVKSLLKLPISFPNTTGVKIPIPGGDILFPV